MSMKAKSRAEELNQFCSAVDLKLTTILVNINKYRRQNPLQVSCDLEVKQDMLWLHLYSGDQSQDIGIPVPYHDEYGNYVLGRRVVRAVGTWHHDGREYTYWRLMAWLLTGRIEKAFPGVSKRSQLERLVQSFSDGNAPLTFRSTQDLIDGIVNRLPLCGTPMETWAMCNRVVILDPEFDSLTPKEALEYQKQKNKEHFPWTSVGLSDSGMCNNNLLKVDLRRYTPFGIKHHNPMRNLYQTLGMKGDERPLVQTKSSAKLEKDYAIQRRGWNLMTCFLDIPLNFEDQIIVDNRHLDKFTLDKRRFLCFGDVLVQPGEEIEEGQELSEEPNGKKLQFWIRSDRAIVTDVRREKVVFNGREREASFIYVETRHAFKEGIKLTNCHGNKGVVTFADCGVMYDEGRQQTVPLDLIVSARTIGKRKNYGQVLEILLTLLRGPDKPIVIPDDAEVPVETLKRNLRNRGYAEDGTSTVDTPWFQGRAVCGWGFWGLIKNPENQLWTKAEVTAVDNRGLRKAGVKISHIEFKALTTIFGARNPVVNEILSYQQGFEDVYQMIQILETLRGKPMQLPLLDWQAIKPLEQSQSYFHQKEELIGTMADEDLLPEGFMLQLPCLYHVFTPDDPTADVDYRLLPAGEENLENYAKADGENVFLDKIYVPAANLRRPWEHSTGMLGLSDVSGHLNNILLGCRQLVEGNDEALLRALNRYFQHVSRRLSTKAGEISTYALAVRYPNSAKATATLAKEGLPENWVEIHTDMADNLGVEEGDYVLAERFPCLGFKSLRIQRVRVTSDPQCRYVIRVSGNSLVSQNLDFDGDVLFLMSFKTEAAKEALKEEFHQPNELRSYYIKEANAAKVPTTGSLNIDQMDIKSFPLLTAERQAEIVEGLTGLKRGTGTIVALAYNLMRIIEGNVGYNDRETNLAMEVILDKVANSVFGQKHAGDSLEERCKQAICTANVEEMLKMGFPEQGSRRLCQIIAKEAESLGINDLEHHYQNHLTRGRSNVINIIVRRKHPFYFATRANLRPVRLLEHTEGKPTDLTAHLWYRALKLRKENHEMS